MRPIPCSWFLVTSALSGLPAAELIVDPAGSTAYTTIQAALDAAASGDTVTIRGGTYRELPVVKCSNLTITAATASSGGYESVTLTTADAVTGWTAAGLTGQPAIWQASFTSTRGLGNGVVWVDGVMQVPARWPNITPTQLVGMTNANKATANAGSATYDSNQQVVNASTTAGWYTTASDIPAVDWTGAKISYLPGAHWFFFTAAATVDAALDKVSFTGSFNTNDTYCQAGNPFYLWGVRGALDQASEWFHDATANRLYLWAPGSADPNGLLVEAKVRDYTLDLSGQDHVTVQGLKLVGGPWRTNLATDACTLRDLTITYVNHREDWSTTDNNAIGSESSLTLNGDDNLVEHCEIAYSGRSTLTISGKRNTVRNNVIHHVSYLGTGGAVDHQYGVNGRSSNAGGSDRNFLTQNTIYEGGYMLVNAPSAMDVTYNDVFHSHRQGADIGAITSWGTDGKDSVIAWNTVHHNDGLLDLRKRWFGGNAIYLDNGTSDYLIHHNITWESTAYGIKLMNHTKTGVPNQKTTTSDRRVIANTVHGEIDTQDQGVTGSEVRSNLAKEIHIRTAVTASGNVAYATADPRWVDADSRDYHLRASSLAIDAGESVSGINDTFTGSAPDAGTYEGEDGTWVAGAVITTADLAQLTVTVTTDAAGTLAVSVSGLPTARKLPADFSLTIGSQTITNLVSVLDPATGAVTAHKNGIAASSDRGSVAVSARIGASGAWTSLGMADVDGLTVSSASVSSGVITVSGKHFTADQPVSYEQTLTLAHSAGTTAFNYPVLLTLDTKALVDAGRVDAALDNLRFSDADGTVPYWIERGANTTATRIWVNVPKLIDGATLTMSYGPSLGRASASSGSATFAYFDDFADGSFDTSSAGDFSVRTPAITTISETGGRLHIDAGMDSNVHTMQGIQARSTFPWPTSGGYAMEARTWLSFTGTTTLWKANLGGHDGTISLLENNNSAGDIGYYQSGTQIIASDTSTLPFAGFTDQTVGVAFSPENDGQTTQRWLEDGVVKGTRTDIASTEKGYFMVATQTSGVSFQMQLDDLRIRQVVFPEPTVTVGSTVTTLGGPVRLYLGSQEVSGVTRDSATSLHATLPTWTGSTPSGALTVSVVDQDGNRSDLAGQHLYAPTISVAASATTNEDTAATLAVTIGDVETATASLTLTASAANTTLIPTVTLGGSGANRTVTATPAANASGSTVLTVTVTDGGGMTTSATCTLTVTAVNDAPTVATPLTALTLDEGQVWSATLPAGTFADIEGDPLTWSVSGRPSWMSFNAATRTLSGTPGLSDAANLSLTVQADDGQGGSVSTPLTVTVLDTPGSTIVPPASSEAGSGSGGGNGCGGGSILGLIGWLCWCRRRPTTTTTP